jgi:type II secretory pathway pseudopilin PulG
MNLFSTNFNEKIINNDLFQKESNVFSKILNPLEKSKMMTSTSLSCEYDNNHGQNEINWEFKTKNNSNLIKLKNSMDDIQDIAKVLQQMSNPNNNNINKKNNQNNNNNNNNNNNYSTNINNSYVPFLSNHKNFEQKFIHDEEHKNEIINEISFSYKMKQKKRRRRRDEIDRKYQCPIPSCNKTYGSEGAVKTHLRLKHSHVSLQFEISPKQSSTFKKSHISPPSSPSSPLQTPQPSPVSSPKPSISQKQQQSQQQQQQSQQQQQHQAFQQNLEQELQKQKSLQEQYNLKFKETEMPTKRIKFNENVVLPPLRVALCDIETKTKLPTIKSNPILGNISPFTILSLRG